MADKSWALIKQRQELQLLRRHGSSLSWRIPVVVSVTETLDLLDRQSRIFDLNVGALLPESRTAPASHLAHVPRFH